MEFKSEYYNETQIDSFIISYGFKEGIISEKNIIKSDLSFQKYKNNNLVISFNPLDFGKVLTINKLVNETLYILQTKDNLITKILSSENQNSIEIFKDADLIIKFIDFKLSENKFVRIIENKKYYFENNKQILFSKENNSKFIRVLPKSNKLANNFITLDIETYIKNNVLMHNIAKFDIIFLLKHLVKLGDVTPIIHNGRIISINLNFGKNLEYRLQFKDSYLILLASLDKLTKGFIVETLKSIFPFLFVNEDNLDYIGEVPEFKYFYNNIKLSEYNNYISKFYNN